MSQLLLAKQTGGAKVICFCRKKEQLSNSHSSLSDLAPPPPADKSEVRVVGRSPASSSVTCSSWANSS